nr:MAG TPA: hypothetical protein [Siphoviridae sp. ctCjJ10]
MKPYFSLFLSFFYRLVSSISIPSACRFINTNRSTHFALCFLSTPLCFIKLPNLSSLIDR